MATTYDSIATTTLGSAAASITFSSIAATYTDLRVVLVGTATTGGSSLMARYNSDATITYSWTELLGNGSAASSGSGSNNRLYVSENATLDTTIPHMYTLDIFSYAGSIYKTSLSTAQADNNGSGNIERAVGLWRNTAAINTILLYSGSDTFKTGTTATLYGIKAA